jgi:hypothetical protein
MRTQTAARALSRLGVNERGPDPHPRQPVPMLLEKAEGMFGLPDWTDGPERDGFKGSSPRSAMAMYV